jgi:AraC-like DNA-binding protein
MYYSIDLMSDFSERVRYNNPNLPVLAIRSKLSAFQGLTVPSHWHDDVEFILVLSGHMMYSINGKTMQINSGNGIFINSRQLHSNFSTDGTDCEYICMLLHPALLCVNPFLQEKFVNPVTLNRPFTHLTLNGDNPWQAEILDMIQSINKLYENDDKSAALMVQSYFYRIWSILYEHMPVETHLSSRMNNQLSALLAMVGFVQKHYNQKITLSDIAKAGNVCVSSCCELFNQRLRQTPIGYLTSYRLSKSLELLKDTTISITETALAVGFSGGSYFTETFRKHYNLTPTEYRKQAAGK